MAAEAAKSTDVLSRIISMYASTATSDLVSNAMSLCWPSHTSRDVVLNMPEERFARAWRAWIPSAVKAKVYITSPDRMAAFSDHFM